MEDSEKTLTFTKKVKNELAGVKTESHKAQKALLSGFVRLSGDIAIGSRPSLSCHTELSSVAKLAFNLLKSIYGVQPNFIFERKMRFDKSMVFVVRVDGKEVYDIAADLKVQKNLRPSKIRAMVNRENLRYFARGLFLSSGSINPPESKSYFLEITMDSQEDALIVAKALQESEGRFSFKVSSIRSKYLVYLKKGSEIAEFLAWLGASESTLDYENKRVEKDFFNNENRLEIAYAANYNKSLKTGAGNVEDIEAIKRTSDFDHLSPKEVAAVRCRLQNKDFSYVEIAQALTKAGFPLTKSSVARIFAKIRSLAQKQRQG